MHYLAIQYIMGQIPVIQGTITLALIFENGFTKTGTLCQSHSLPDCGAIYVLGKITQDSITHIA